MVFKRYHFQILLRLVLIVANSFGILYLLQLRDYRISFYNLIGLLILQIFLLFRLLTRWQEEIRLFSNSVNHGDYNISYHLLDKHDPHYELYLMLNRVAAYVRDLKAQATQQNHYFKYIVENAQVGLMAYEESGVILLVNDEALKLIGATRLKTIHQLRDVSVPLYNELIELPINQPKVLHHFARNSMRISARSSDIVLEGKKIRLLSLINIKSELDENEMHSWQGLISVLTHEIMNSVTPIHSLTTSMQKYLDRIAGNEEHVAKAKHSLDVVSRRSQMLMTFVDRYRKISAIPLPHLENTDIGKLIEDVIALLASELSDITVNFKYEPLVIPIDAGLIEQVLINILKNAINALRENDLKRITISISKSEDKIQVKIADNGRGIDAQIKDKIFIPFFTTTENGSGIGLTLSRQIMHRHGGTIELQSEGEGAVFILNFPLIQLITLNQR